LNAGIGDDATEKCTTTSSSFYATRLEVSQFSTAKSAPQKSKDDLGLRRALALSIQGSYLAALWLASGKIAPKHPFFFPTLSKK